MTATELITIDYPNNSLIADRADRFAGLIAAWLDAKAGKSGSVRTATEYARVTHCGIHSPSN